MFTYKIGFQKDDLSTVTQTVEAPSIVEAIGSLLDLVADNVNNPSRIVSIALTEIDCR